MTASQKFEAISWLSYVLLIALPLAIVHFSPVPRTSILRAVVAVFLAWALLICYTALIYNPAGIAAGHEVGAHFPESRFDNNTISSALVAGWIAPAGIVGLYFLCRRIMQPNNSLKSDAAKPRTLG